MLTKEQIHQLASVLGERERILRGEVRQKIQEKFGRDLPELNSPGDDSARSVTDLLENIDTGIMVRDVDELLAIEAARAAMKGGSYGTCVMCHGPIGFKRLIALPTAVRCLSCQEQHEIANGKQPELRL